MIKNYEDMVAFSKDNMDAMVKSSNTWSQGFEQLSKECFSYMGRAMDNASNNAKKYSSCKSAVEALQMGSEQTKATIEDWVSQSKKVADISNGIAQDATAPLNARYKAVSETMNKNMGSSMNDFTSEWNKNWSNAWNNTCCSTKK
jgi:phasin family protein